MRRLSLLLLFASLLAGCRGQPAPPYNGGEATATSSLESIASAGSSCTSVAAEPTPNATIESLFPPVNAQDHLLGSVQAPAKITLYSDFQCTACAELAGTLEQLAEVNDDQLAVAFRPFPMASVNDKALLAAQAAEAAAEQDEFWKMYDYLYSSQADWTSLTPEDFESWLTSTAAPAVGLDGDQFAADFKRQDIVDRVQSAWEFGRDTGLPGAPFMLINGQIYTGPDDYDNLSRITSLLALGERQFKICPGQVIDQTKDYIATLHTEKGDIVVELFADKAPVTVNSFVFLAQRGWFDNITWHRVIPGFVAQTGDPTATGMGGPGYYINNEIDPSLTYDREGLLGMANSGPDTNGSQFFITLGPAPHLNGQYTIFGEVIEGMDVVRSLAQRDPQPGQVLPPGDTLLSVTIEEK
jgi:cyclophilin family peptidyl-prolyl cis-trans isomerase/protein-disulfide isomerase